jgi:RNA polymerase sigma-70 factor, ECF subfamily
VRGGVENLRSHLAGPYDRLRRAFPTGADVMSPSAATYTDIELVELARGGDRAAFDELLFRHDDRMRALAFRLLADRAAMDDVLLDTYLEAYKALPGLRPGKDFGSWLYRLTYNACIDEIRRRADEGLDRPSRQPVHRASGTVSTSELVREALGELSAGQRVTLVLVDGEGFDHEEAAEILGVSPGAVASRLYRARTALRRRLWGHVR